MSKRGSKKLELSEKCSIPRRRGEASLSVNKSYEIR